MAQGPAIGPMDGVDGVDGGDGVDGVEGLDLLGGRGGGGVYRPVGLAPEFARRRKADNSLEQEYRSHKWPPSLKGVAWPPNVTKVPGNWPVAPSDIAPRLADFSPSNASLIILAEFVRVKGTSGGVATDWTRLMTKSTNALVDDMQKDIAAQNGIPAELAELRQLAQFRGGVMGEALAQRNGIIGYFRGLLHFSVATHPYTYYLCASALRVGQFLCMHYKGVFNRPRPMRIDPSIMSPIDPPAHSAYPSGHAIQSFLIARCLEAVVPPTVGSGLAGGDGQQSPYWRLAERIAKLREVLGVHYPSDTVAGRRVAAAAFPLLMACPRIAGGAVAEDTEAAEVLGKVELLAGYAEGWLARARREWRG